MTTYKNKITRLPEERKTQEVDGVKGYADGARFYGEGESIYTWYMPKYAGVDPETGESLFYVDKKDDKGNITQATTTKYGDATKHLCGTSLPSTYGGFGTTFNFKGFDVAANFTYQLGGKVYDISYANSMSFDRGAVFHKDLLNAWTPET